MRKRLDSPVITAAIRQAKASGQRIELWDTTEHGLCARVEPSGKVAFQYRYRVAGRQRRLRLGYFGSMTVTDARDAAGDARRAVDKGGDPQAIKVGARGGLLLADAFTRFIEEPTAGGAVRKPATLVQYGYLWRKHLAPVLGRWRVDAITTTDVERLKVGMFRKITALRESKVNKGKPVYGQAAAAVTNRVIDLLSAIMGAAERWGELPRGANPCRGVTRFKEEKRERFLRPEERAALERVMAAAEARPWRSKGAITPWAALALRLLSWTGARTSEITGLRWGMVDLDNAVLNLPDSKTGRKSIPLGPHAVRLLQAVRPENPEPDAVVCRTSTGGEIEATSLGNTWRRLRKTAGIPDIRKHDLRHSFASDALNAGTPLPFVGAMLGHSNPQTTARYAHLCRDVVQQWTAKADSAIAASLEAGSTVVRLPVAAKGKAPSKSKGTSKPARGRAAKR